MKLSIELILAIWGAVVSTILAIFEIAKERRQRPKIKVDATVSFHTCNEEKETHGVKVKVQRGDDILVEEALVEITIRNFGLQPIQITAVYIETENNSTQVIPKGFPVILQPNTSVTANVQPEWFAPVTLDEKAPKSGTLKPREVISIGVFDALGKEHPINKENVESLVESCRNLPLRVGVFKHKETGNLVTAFQIKDQAVKLKKQS
jgi:hypothetical protein